MLHFSPDTPVQCYTSLPDTPVQCYTDRPDTPVQCYTSRPDTPSQCFIIASECETFCSRSIYVLHLFIQFYAPLSVALYVDIYLGELGQVEVHEHS